MNKLRAALEAIDFQGPEFANKLISLFEIILASTTAKLATESKALKEVVDLTFKTTGIKIDLTFENDYDSYTYTPYINGSHIFTDPMFRGFETNDTNRLLTLMQNFKSRTYVDLKNAKVGGFFSEVVSPIYLGWQEMQYINASAKECVAIFLHELGHIFTMYEFYTRTIFTNQALACVTRSLNSVSMQPSDPKHQYVLKKLGEIIDDNADYFQEISEIKDGTIITSVIIGKTFRPEFSDMKTIKYDYSSCEAQADAFAARFGLGRDLVTYLVKVNKTYGTAAYSSFERLNIIFVETVSLVFKPTLAISASIVTGNLVYLLLLLITFMSVLLNGETFKDFTYDDLKVRFARIKEQLVSSIKNQKVSNADKKLVLYSIKEIEAAMAEAKNTPSIYRTISNFIFPFNRKLKNMIELQRDLEVLSANDIYSRAAELSLDK